MKEFVLIFRESNDRNLDVSPEDMQAVFKAWMQWMADIEAAGQLADKGNRLSTAASSARTVKPGDVITDGPFVEIKEFINGYMIVKTATIEEAVAIARRCPILKMEGNVEVRTAIAVDDNS